VTDRPVASTGSYRIADAAHIGYVHLRVRDLERSLAFYLDVLGFKLVGGGPHTATLSATGRGPGLIVLTAKKDASARPPRSPGLYHFAIRVPNRHALAMVIRHLEMNWPVQGYADHDVSEAVYLADPDGIGIEVYADRPRDEWPLRSGQVEMVTEPLELDNLMSELDAWPGNWEGIDPATDIGHVHLRVASLEAGEAFYNGLLGFDVMQRDLAGALFLGAGGYHHHIGINTWGIEPGVRAPADAVGLISFQVLVPDGATVTAIGQRLFSAGAPTWSQDDGSLRAADPDHIFIEFFTR